MTAIVTTNIVWTSSCIGLSGGKSQCGDARNNAGIIHSRPYGRPSGFNKKQWIKKVPDYAADLIADLAAAIASARSLGARLMLPRRSTGASTISSFTGIGGAASSSSDPVRT